MLFVRIASYQSRGEPGGDWYTPEGYPRKPIGHIPFLCQVCVWLSWQSRDPNILSLGENAGVFVSYCHDECDDILIK